MRLSAAVHPKCHKAEEDGDAHEGGSGGGREKLAVLNLKVPEHGQHQHEQRQH